jgi:hypothetical protein
VSVPRCRRAGAGRGCDGRQGDLGPARPCR